MTRATLVFLIRDRRILLAMKKRGHGVGKWNGAGGKIEPGETPAAAAARETTEEIGVRPTLDEQHGQVLYLDPVKGDIFVTVFRTEEFAGEPIESEEMRPQWWPIDQVPYDEMWDNDRYWLPHVINNQRFIATFAYDETGRLIQKKISPITI